MNQVSDTVLNLWKTGRKITTSSSGWISSNAVCCPHNGESADTRGRGSIITSATGSLTYKCFNCNYKASYISGRTLSYKFRKLLGWLGASENDVQHLVIEAIRVRELIALTEPATLPEPDPVEYKARPLPSEAVSFLGLVEFYELANRLDYPAKFVEAVSYVSSREINMQKYEFFWTPEVDHKLNYRVIVPFKWNSETIGYSARAILNGINPKYHSQYEPNYVFNMDQQHKDNKFVLVCEGIFDAMSVDGVAVLHNECSEAQADIIDNLGKEVIVVPDFDVYTDEYTNKKKWPGAKLIDNAIDYGWTVSFPVWHETCKDINDAVVKYGNLFVLKTIIDSRHRSRLKIELMKRKILNG